MATYNQLPVYKATYDLLLYVYQTGKDVQRDYRYTLGETLKRDLITILTLIYRANANRQKVEIIVEAREKLVAVKLQLRLLHDLKQLSLKNYANASLMTESISKQLSAWQKSYEGRIRAYYDARKHKRNTRSQLEFEFNLEENLVKLYEELRDRTYKVGRSVCFITGNSVKREVFAAHFRDRVVHHLLYNYTAPIFERTFIADSYSCRKGMGTLYGVQRFEHHLRACSDNWKRSCYVLKLDIRGYFMHIVRQKLYDQVMGTLWRHAGRKNSMGRYWADALDYSLLEYLMREIIFNDPTFDCEMRGTSKDWE